MKLLIHFQTSKWKTRLVDKRTMIYECKIPISLNSLVVKIFRVQLTSAILIIPVSVSLFHCIARPWRQGIINLALSGFSSSNPDRQCHIMDKNYSWWHHQMETFLALLALCERNPPVTGGFPSQRPVTRSFDIFSDLHLNKRASKQLRRRWFQTPSRPLWRHFNTTLRLMWSHSEYWSSFQ